MEEAKADIQPENVNISTQKQFGEIINRIKYSHDLMSSLINQLFLKHKDLEGKTGKKLEYSE